MMPLILTLKNKKKLIDFYLGETSEADVSTSEKKLSKKRKYQCDDGDFTTHQGRSVHMSKPYNSFKTFFLLCIPLFLFIIISIG